MLSTGKILFLFLVNDYLSILGTQVIGLSLNDVTPSGAGVMDYVTIIRNHHRKGGRLKITKYASCMS